MSIMHLNIIVWNCNALREFRRTLHEIIQKHKPDFLGFLETRISGEQADSTCMKLDQCGGFGFQRRNLALLEKSVPGKHFENPSTIYPHAGLMEW